MAKAEVVRRPNLGPERVLVRDCFTGGIYAVPSVGYSNIGGAKYTLVVCCNLTDRKTKRRPFVTIGSEVGDQILAYEDSSYVFEVKDVRISYSIK